jgi:GTP-binding protein EngB required for normal cell division
MAGVDDYGYEYAPTEQEEKKDDWLQKFIQYMKERKAQKQIDKVV